MADSGELGGCPGRVGGSSGRLSGGLLGGAKEANEFDMLGEIPKLKVEAETLAIY